MAVTSAPIRLALILLASALAIVSPDALPSIFDTKHNLVPASPPAASRAPRAGLQRVSSHGAGAPLHDAATEAARVCTFCHTPYGESGASPAWQSAAVEGETSFPTYASVGSTSRGSATELGSVSIACMSCHDGTQAVNVTGYPMVTQSPHRLQSGEIPPERVATQAPLTVNLGASHPVGVRYLGDAPGTSRLMSVSPMDDPLPVREFRVGFRTAEHALINGVPVWWVETGNPGRQREDIHLFAREAGEGMSEPYVECSSCHDPHATSRMFLRHAEPDGFLCGTCHVM